MTSLATPNETQQIAKGLDVSSHNAPIDWHAAAAEGYRVGVVRLTSGLDADRRAIEHSRGVRAAGLVLGAYGFFLPWANPRTLLDAFQRVADAVGYGEPGDLFPWLDVESWTGHTADSTWSANAETLADLYAERFGGCFVYLNAADWARMGGPDWIGRHCLACAHYTDKPAPLTAGGLDWTIWQWRVAPVPGSFGKPLDQTRIRLPLATIPYETPRPVVVQRTQPIVIPHDFAEHERIRNANVARRPDVS